MESHSFNEIIDILEKAQRADLVNELQELKSKIVDDNYSPTQMEIRESKDDDSCSSGEEEYLAFSIDEDGFYQLEDDP
jgi:predicted ribosome-associated RNA-binding protein Tma20